jgi:hypothetical protein
MITNILAPSTCRLQITSPQNQTLTLQTVSGNFNPIILDKTDWIQFSTFRFQVTQRIINMDLHELNQYLTSIYVNQCTSLNIPHDSGAFETDPITMITTFPATIQQCSDRFKHIYSNNPRDLPCSKSEKLAQTNGPQFLIIKTNGMATAMRFSNPALTNDTRAANMGDVVSINQNFFTVGYPFILQGESYHVTTTMLKDIEFKIVDVFDNEVEIINDLMWSFLVEDQ